MISQIAKLSQDLRAEGLPVSIRSTNDAYDVYCDIGCENQSLLKFALRSIYVKDKYDIAKFDKIFDENFKIIKEEENIQKQKNKSKYPHAKLAKSNKYVIKKNNAKSKAIEKDRMDNKMLKHLSGQPLLDEFDTLEKEGELINQDLTKLNKFDPRMLEICQKLGRKIANKRSKRKYKANSNKIDMRRTLRANMKYGGVPLELVKAKPRPHKNEHVFLNDISGSCEWISSWFFMLMYSSQMAFKKSRTFEFDNKVIETTEALKEEYMLNSFIKVRDMRMNNKMIHGTSNMYTAFKSFLDKVELNNKSYVIILSDCRDWAGPKVDGVQKSVEFIEQMAKEAKKVIILNPEDRYKWDIVDSCVSLYENAGAQIFEVNTLNQLAQFVESM